MQIARLLNPEGQIAREWLTDRPDLAGTADRNCPLGWRVVTPHNSKVEAI